MSKPIKLTESLRTQIQDELISQILQKLKESVLTKEALDSLAKAQMSDGQFSFSKTFKYEKKFEYQNDKRRVTINITPDAYAKMLTVIMSNSEEVGWHGVSEKIGDYEYLVKDILLYPQKVTGTTVDTDDEEYAKWLIDLDKIDEEIFPNLHFHGHSHVNMGTSPSTTDMGHRTKIVDQLGNEDYYIFMIWNKRLEWSASVYDMKTNTLYESADIDVMITFGDGSTAGDVIKSVKDNVKQRTYTSSTPKVYPVETKKNEPKAPQKSWWEEERERKAKEVNEIGNDLDDFRRQYYGYGYGYGGNYYY